MSRTQTTVVTSVSDEHQVPFLIRNLNRQIQEANVGTTINQIQENMSPVQPILRLRPDNDVINHWSNQSQTTNISIGPATNNVRTAINLNSSDEALQDLPIAQMVPGFLNIETLQIIPIPEATFSEEGFANYVGTVRRSFTGNQNMESSPEVSQELSRALLLVKEDIQTRVWNRMDLERLRSSTNLMQANLPLVVNQETVEMTSRVALVAILHLLSPETLHQIGIVLLGAPLGTILTFFLPLRILLISLMSPMIWVESFRTLITHLREGIFVVRRTRQTMEINELRRRAGQLLLRFDWSWNFFHRTLFREEWRTRPNLMWLTARAGTWSLLTLITRWGLFSAILRTYGINTDYVLWQLVDLGGIHAVSAFLEWLSSLQFFF